MMMIGTINLQNAKDEIKLAELAHHVNNKKNDICLFQETHKTGNEEIEFYDAVLFFVCRFLLSYA